MKNEDIRWKQRFINYKKALSQLSLFIEKGDELNKLEEQGLIKAFEYTFELSWNLIKDYYEYQGETGIQGSRDAFRIAFNRGLINDGEIWMDMIESRIKTSHTYNEETVIEIINAIRKNYYNIFISLRDVMSEIKEK
jgi:nucleotidyltransferase substrate binding protein (TIGR01987 family)